MTFRSSSLSHLATSSLISVTFLFYVKSSTSLIIPFSVELKSIYTMAASASMQSIFLANSVVYGAGKKSSVRVNQLVPTLHRYPNMRVRSMAEVIN